MKFHKIDSWAYDDSMNCMLFFASLIDEMTFNYTIDSYKAPVMNVISLLEELFYTISDVEDGLIADGAVGSIVEEVRLAIEDDEVFRQILNDHQISYVQELFKTDNKRDLKVAIDLLSSFETINIEYVVGLKNTLSLLIKQNKEKKRIEKLTRLLITQLKYLGYSNEFIYHHNLRFFFSRDSKIDNVDKVDEFLTRFDFSVHHFKVVCIGETNFRMMKSHLRKMGDNVYDDFDFSRLIDNNYEHYKKEAKEKNGCYVEINVDAFDFYQARKEAFERIDKFCVLFSFFHHKTLLKVNDDCVAIDLDTKEHTYLKAPVRSIIKCGDMRPRDANRIFRIVADNLNVEEDSMSRLLKAIWLHRQALMSDTEENQFVNLFTALEVLMPKDVNAGKDRIRQISDVLIPVLCLAYYQKLVTSLVSDLAGWKIELLKNIFKEVEEGNDLIEKFVGMLCLSKYEGLRDKVYTNLTTDKNVLAVHRIYRLSEIFNKPKDTLEFIIRHEKRLRQHIDRLYRTRNMIVHSGETVENIGALLENLHFYFDVIINAILNNSVNRKFMKLEFTFTSAIVKYRYYKKVLETTKDFNENNCVELILAK